MKEVKKTFTYTTTPSKRKKASDRAIKEGSTLSEKIDQFITWYTIAPKFKRMDGRLADPMVVIGMTEPHPIEYAKEVTNKDGSIKKFQQ